MLSFSFFICFHSFIFYSKAFVLDEIPFNRNAFDAASKLPVLASKETDDIFGDGSAILYTQRNGTYGNNYVVENRKKNLYLQVDLDFSSSRNVVTEDGGFIDSLMIPPGQSCLVRHVMPIDPAIDWSAEWTSSGRFMTAAEASDHCAPIPADISLSVDVQLPSLSIDVQIPTISTQGTVSFDLSPNVEIDLYSSACKPAESLRRIPSDLVFYSADHDQDKTYPNGAHEYVHNLGDEGKEPWNKWYSSPFSSSLVTTINIFNIPLDNFPSKRI